MEEGKKAGGGPHAGVKGPGKESYRGITRLLRSADSPEEIIAATHVSDYGYRARPPCARIDSQRYTESRPESSRKHGKHGLIAGQE